ncbi:hypothetical protein FSP39_001549 [Pinctada imbricata]|uniref:Uncharacterized protein n=1 Tax=Pinctada imbricata TaxID=66713 RepID=A0AA88Y263_PINIB|nr:hypothetical protein FSP39_001549 [Pinctada imbricata]
MTKKTNKKYAKGSLKTPVKTYEQQPVKFAGAICPLNLEEQKEKFLKHGKLPKFVLKGSEEEIENLYQKACNQIRFDLFGEAEHILKVIKEKYGDGENYLDAMYGERISKEQATEVLTKYLVENNLDGAMSIIWCNDLVSSAKMMWIGPHAKANKPESRTYSFWIKDNLDNIFIRDYGIRCLADHEIGTHFFRSFNDGLQPWYSDRKRFNLRGLGSLEELRTEEGLAAINTILNAKAHYLWGPALQYYSACKSAEMTFKQLYDHLSMYIKNTDYRWRLCMRVKRGLIDPNDLGGYGKDQCYFEGAVEILRNLDEIDFQLLMSGKMCVDELNRCKRLSRTDCVKLPAFMRNETKYKKQLRAISTLNGLNMQRPKVNPPAVYMQRLRRGRRIGPENGKKVRHRVRRTKNRSKVAQPGSGSDSITSSESTESECEEKSTETKKGQGNKKPASLPFKPNFLFEPMGDNILSDLVSCCRDQCNSAKPEEKEEKDDLKLQLDCSYNNNMLYPILNDMNGDRQGYLEQRMHPSESPWTLMSGLASNNSNVCTTVIYDGSKEPDLDEPPKTPEVTTHRSVGSESRFSALSYLTDSNAARFGSKSAKHSSVFPHNLSPEYCLFSKVARTVYESGPERFIYPEKSDLLEEMSCAPPLTSRSEAPQTSHPKTLQSTQVIQLPKLLDRRAKSAANCLRKFDI